MNDKKRIILTVIGIVFILILIFGATYAYFSVEVTNDNEVTNVDVDADEIGSVALTNPTPNLHLSLSSKDMSLDNVGEYYATNDSNKYFDEEKIQREILGINLIGGNSSDVYECNATLNINLEGTAVNAFQKGDAYIQFGGLLTDKVDLTEIPSDGYDISAYLVPEQSATRKITASIALVNKVGDQSYLAGKSLSVNITNSDFNCTLTEMGNNTITSSNSGTLAISGAVGTELNNYKIYGNSIQNGTPSPTNPVEIESVGDYDEESGKYVVPITVSGKNLLNIRNRTEYVGDYAKTSKRELNGNQVFIGMSSDNYYGGYASGYSILENNGITFISGSVGYYGVGYDVEVKPNTSYTLRATETSGELNQRIAIAEYQEDGTWIKHAHSTSGQLTVTTTENTKWIIVLMVAIETKTTFTYTEIQLEDGSNATEYEPYVEPITTNIYLDEPLRKIGEASDYIDFATQKVVRNIAEIKLTGAETWYGSIENGGYTYIVPATKKLGTTNVVSNYFPTIFSYAIDTNYVNGRDNNRAIAFSPVDSVATTNAEWISWLEAKNSSGNPLIVQYELETGVEKAIDLPDIPTIDGTTIIEVGTTIVPSSIDANYIINP